MKVLITGAGNGIGFAITKYFIERGIFVIATDLRVEKLLALPDDCLAVYRMDVTKDSNIVEIFETIREKYDGIDAIIHSAGIFVGGSLIEVEPSKMEQILNVNILGAYRVNRYFFQLLNNFKSKKIQKSVKPKIIHMSSECGRLTALPFNGPYSISKYGLEAYSDSLRRELSLFNIDVVVIQPGAIATNFESHTVQEYNQNLEQSVFKRQLQQVVKKTIQEYNTSLHPEKVANLCYQILHKKRPKIRYKIGNNLLRCFLDLLPDHWIDFAIKKYMENIKQS